MAYDGPDETKSTTDLVIGSGGREDALRRVLTADRVLVAPGNGGTPPQNRRAVTDIKGIIELCRDEHVRHVIAGPEAPLLGGLADRLAEVGISVFGPCAAVAQLEGSKAHARRLCRKLGIPIPQFVVVNSPDEAAAVMSKWGWGPKIVVKADGPAAGKGVCVAESKNEAMEFVNALMIEKLFGDSGKKILLEEGVEGYEISLMAICRGRYRVVLPLVRDFKRAYDGDQGPNTGSMGAYAPVPDVCEGEAEWCAQTFIDPVLRHLDEQGTPYHGCLYAQLMITKEGPKLIEYNVRFGDPECQVLSLLVENFGGLINRSFEPDGLKGMYAAVRPGAAVCFTVAADAYPGPIMNPNAPIKLKQVCARVYHAGTHRREDGEFIATGGRVFSVVGFGADHAEARTAALGQISHIDFSGKRHRTDIALDVRAVVPA